LEALVVSGVATVAVGWEPMAVGKWVELGEGVMVVLVVWDSEASVV
jgi:hypothetical protein